MDDNRTKLLIEYLQALSNLKLSDYYANKEIGKVIELIEVELGIK